MATSENGKVQIETGQTLVAYAAMTDSGDHTIYTAGTVWSGKSGYTPSVRPNGIVTGSNLLSTHASNDTVTIAAFTAYIGGTLYTVGATTKAITRTATASKAMIHSICLDNDGATINSVAGTIGSGQTFSETRNAAGGPPYIAVDDIELGQVRVTTATAAVIASTEIFQVVGTHTERYDYPVWTENNIGLGSNTTVAAKKNAHVVFADAHPAIHTGAAYKKTYIQYYTPSYQTVSRATDFKPCENTHSVTSTQIYGGTIGSTASSLGQGGFTAYLSDGIADSLVLNKDQNLTVRFYPDENKTPYILTQGKIGLTRTFPAANQNQATVTISSEVESAEFTS